MIDDVDKNDDDDDDDCLLGRTQQCSDFRARKETWNPLLV